MADTRPALLHLLAARPGAERSARLAALTGGLPATTRVALLLEGARPDGPEGTFGPAVTVHQVAGCPCCVGQLPLRTALVRILRVERPEVVVIALLQAKHLEALRGVLQRPPYDAFLTPAPCPAEGARPA